MINQNKLMPMFSYSILPILFFGLIIIGIIIYLFLTRKKKEKPIVIMKPTKKELLSIKNNYLEQLDNLSKNDKLSIRKTYQTLSVIIRNFIYEVTQIKVPYYSLEEIKQTNIPELTQLVEEYYHPEFAKDAEGAIESSIQKTREVIEKWQ